MRENMAITQFYKQALGLSNGLKMTGSGINAIDRKDYANFLR